MAWDRIILVGVVSFALVMRLVAIDRPLAPDEGYTWLVASAGSPSAFLSRLARYENTPPLYYLLLTPFPLHSPVFVRLPSLICGTTIVAVCWAVVRRDLGRTAGTVAGLVLAVAPYAVAESDFGRGYMLADFWLLLCFWAALRLTRSDESKWWWLFVAGATLAIYSEYDAVTSVLSIAAALLLLRTDARKKTLVWCMVSAIAFVPWVGQLSRSLADFDVTKAGLGYLTVTPASVRDTLISLFLGRTGQDLGPEARTAALVGLVAVTVFLLTAIRQRGSVEHRALAFMTSMVAAGTFALHAVAPVVGLGIFNVGYLTFIIPLGAILLGSAICLAPRAVALAVIAGLVLAGGALAVQRERQPPDIDVRAIGAVLSNAHVHTVLTNSAVIDFYFRRYGARLDRPFNLGPGLAGHCPRCRLRIAVVDDIDVGAGARTGPGKTTSIGHYSVRLLPP